MTWLGRRTGRWGVKKMRLLLTLLVGLLLAVAGTAYADSYRLKQSFKVGRLWMT